MRDHESGFQIDALLLDVMDTLVEDPFFTRMPAFFGMPLQELAKNKSYEVWCRFERGEIDEAEYARTAFHDGRSFDLDGMKREMVDGYRLLEGIEALLDDERARCTPMIAVSNYPIWWQLLEEKLHLSLWLRWDAVSCITGTRKPDADAYLAGARAAEMPPSACIFVDDKEANCEAARALGMRAHRFTDAQSLRAFLAVNRERRT